MDISHIFNDQIFTLIIMPLLIMLARICDVTLGTIRIMFVSRGDKLLAPILGFFEILIWLLAIRQIMQNLENVYCFLGYATGYSLGNYLGIVIEEKVAFGKLIIRVITKADASVLVRTLRSKGFGVTKIDAEGSTGLVNIVYTIIDRVHADRVIRIIEQFNPKAFYTVENVSSVKEGIFPSRMTIIKRMFRKPSRLYRRVRVYQKRYLQRKSK